MSEPGSGVLAAMEKPQSEGVAEWLYSLMFFRRTRASRRACVVEYAFWVRIYRWGFAVGHRILRAVIDFLWPTQRRWVYDPGCLPALDITDVTNELSKAREAAEEKASRIEALPGESPKALDERRAAVFHSVYDPALARYAAHIGLARVQVCFNSTK